MASIQKKISSTGKASWKCTITRKGFPRLVMTFHDEELAKAWAKDTEASLDFTQEVKYRFKDMFSRYLTEIHPKKSKDMQKNEKRHIAFWDSFLGDKEISSVNAPEIELIADTLYQNISIRTGKKITPETRRKYLMTLSFIFNIACLQWKWCSVNPMYYVDKHKKTVDKKEINIDGMKSFHPLKSSFIAYIRQHAEINRLSSYEQIGILAGMAKESVRRLLDPYENSSLLVMVTLANALNLELTLVCKSKDCLATPTQDTL